MKFSILDRVKSHRPSLPNLFRSVSIVVLTIVACVSSAIIMLIMTVEAVLQDPMISDAAKATITPFPETMLRDMWILLAAVILFIGFIAYVRIPEKNIRAA